MKWQEVVVVVVVLSCRAATLQTPHGVKLALTCVLACFRLDPPRLMPTNKANEIRVGLVLASVSVTYTIFNKVKFDWGVVLTVVTVT